jgi:preprotein translocase subunit SecF
MEIIKTETNYNFVRMMKPAVILSFAVIIIGIASLIWHGGPNYGIDFAGGTLIQIKFQNETPADKIRAAFKSIGFEGSIIQDFGPKEVIVRSAESGTDAKAPLRASMRRSAPPSAKGLMKSGGSRWSARRLART